MARPYRRGRYYNYPNLRTDTNREMNQEVKQEDIATAQEVHAMSEQAGMSNQQPQYDTYDNSANVGTDANRNRNVNSNMNNNMNSNMNNNRMQGTQSQNRSTPERPCRVRFFNAAAGYGALEINVAGNIISNNLPFGEVTKFNLVPGGFQQVMIRMIQEPEAVLLNKRIPFRNCMNATAAIINTSTGIEIMMINDMGCGIDEENRACLRVANLSYTSPALDIILENGNPVFEDVRFKYVTEYKQVVPGEYNFNIMLARTAETVKSNTVDVIMPETPIDEGGYVGETENAYAYFFEDFDEGDRYTAYIIGNKNYDPPLRVETVEEKDEDDDNDRDYEDDRDRDND